ncbi:unnamed protein product [Hyaloperonospora brassicae]|uniref:RxLR effector candidate protein n=1 Tax=Hyaloperonospora brassicae TaxID=162125 RepID=A0AAV0UWJ3_HYABA|nr:unnamed protein product [Hyaloperonospora brassicae]
MQVHPFVLFAIVVPLVSALSPAASLGLGLVLPGARDFESSTVTGLGRLRSTDEFVREQNDGQADSFVQILRDIFKPPNPYEKYFKQTNSIGEAFNMLNLGSQPVYKKGKINKRDVIRLFTGRRFKAWSKHVIMKSERNPYDDMFEYLNSRFGDENFANIVQVLMDARKTRKLGMELGEAMRMYYLAKSMTGGKVVM